MFGAHRARETNQDHDKPVRLWVMVVGCVAFGIFWSAGLFVRLDATQDAVLLHYAGRIAKILSCYLVALIAWRRGAKPFTMVVCACVSLTFMAVCSSPLLFGMELPLAASVGINVLYGVSGAFFTLLFAQFFSQFSLRHSQTSIPLAFMVCHLIFIVGLFWPVRVPTALSILASITGPAILIVCLHVTGSLQKMRATEDPVTADSSFRETTFPAKTSKRIRILYFMREYYLVLLGALVLPLFYGIVAQIYTEAGMNAGLFDHTMELITVVALLIVAILAYFEKGRDNLNRFFIFLLPLLATALVLAGDRFAIAGMIVKCSTILFLAAFWAFLAKKSQGNPRIVYIAFGIAQGTNHLSAMVGRIAGHNLHKSMDSMIEVSLAVILLVIWMLALISWQILSYKGRDRIIVKTKPKADFFEQMCHSFAERYALSEREREVLFPFAHGRSASFIADALVISKNTVKTHLRNIYIKAGVHSRQELLDLIESVELPASAQERADAGKPSMTGPMKAP